MTATYRAVDLRPLLLLALLAVAVAAGVATRYRDLPMTRHAQTAHAGQRWTAESIASYMDAGGCQPTEYACPALNYKIAYCDMGDGKAIGLAIGLRVERIITGYMGRIGQWAGRC